MSNPFAAASALNLPFDVELCQEIHHSAMLRLRRSSRYDEYAPPMFVADTAIRRNLIQTLLHPADVEAIFGGVTLEVYKTIQQLYCTRLALSIPRVFHILEKMARQANVPSITYEAVWSICLYLDSRRADSVEVTLDHSDADWRVLHIQPDVQIEECRAERSAITCVVDVNLSKVLAFRVGQAGSFEEDRSMALHDAIVAQRRPDKQGAAGLIWRIPPRILLTSEPVGDFLDACAKLHIEVDRSIGESPLGLALQSDWFRDLPGRQMRKDELSAVFDHYLYKVHGYGPRRSGRMRDQDLTGMVGYNRDPDWQFPALRDFLPRHACLIDSQGEVAFNGLHYTHELLGYWRNRAATLRLSEELESTAWIYLDNEILCQAKARELRRSDGSYRARRIEKR